MSAPTTPRAGGRSAATRALVGLLAFQALGAIGGGVTLLIDTSGGAAGLYAGLLARTPFNDFLWPGLLLTFGLGVPALVVATAIVRRPGIAALSRIEQITGQYWAWTGSVLLGVALMVWIVVQMLLIESSWLQPLMLAVGVGLAGLPLTAGARRDLARPAPGTRREERS
jgi:hypothetical protein